MSSRPGRRGALIVLCGVAALLAVAISAVSNAGAAAGSGTQRKVLERCAALMLGEPTPAHPAVTAAADPQIAAEFSIMRVTRTPSDTLPAASDLTEALAGAHATTYDPSASVRLDLTHTEKPVYAVPATLAAPRLPARCTHLRSLAGLRVAFALRTQETGTGPGICLITTHAEPAEPPVSALPGKRPVPGTKRRTVAEAGCESLTAMASYFGTFGAGLFGAGVPVVLAPDGVSSVTATFASGRQITAPVTGNLVAAASLSTGPANVRNLSRARLLRFYDAALPVTVAENGADGTVLATYTRPPSLIRESVREAVLLERLLGGFSTGSTDDYVSCSARTHRCVAVLVSASCNPRRRRCETSRKIVRYRYVTRRPPSGTTGPVPTGPIRARLNRWVTDPGKLSLALTGAPHHGVNVLVSVNCFSGRNGGTAFGESRPPLQVAVPSRTHVLTVGRHRACGIGVLVVSSQPGPIHARLVRG